MTHTSKKSRIPIRLFFVFCLLSLTIGWSAFLLSGGYPWGVDDGVKRLMAEALVNSGGKTLNLQPVSSADVDQSYFPIPAPFVTSSPMGYQGIFPGLFPFLGGIFLVLFGPFGFYLLPAALFAFLLCYLHFMLSDIFKHRWIRWWVLIIAGCTLIFYGFTFWEHALALVLLIPLYRWVLTSTYSDKRFIWVSIAAGFAFVLRPESLFFMAPVVIITPKSFSEKVTVFWKFCLGILVALIISCSLEYFFIGRWISPQVQTNIILSHTGEGFVKFLTSMVQFIFSSPLPTLICLLVVLGMGLISVLLRKPIIFALGLPLLAGMAIIYSYTKYSAFGMTASSQGFFFAFSWMGCCFLNRTDLTSRKFLSITLITLTMAYLSGGSFLGMHWGPRFIFPFLIPLLIVAGSNLNILSRRQLPWLLSITSLVAILFGGSALLALGERGSACESVGKVISGSAPRVIITERWYTGADLQPLWGDKSFYWVKGAADLEEFLIIHGEQFSTIGLIHFPKDFDLNTFPLTIRSKHLLPDRAGWGGTFVEADLRGDLDERWGRLYWHSARRLAEQGEYSEAGNRFQKAAMFLPHSADLLYDWAVCQGRLGQIGEAVATLKEVLRINPDHQQAASLLRSLGVP
jgi:hypothetical protein